MGSATGTAIVTLKESVPSIKSERAREITTHNKCIHTLIIGVLYDRFSLKKFRIQMEKNESHLLLWISIPMWIMERWKDRKSGIQLTQNSFDQFWREVHIVILSLLPKKKDSTQVDIYLCFIP